MHRLLHPGRCSEILPFEVVRIGVRNRRNDESLWVIHLHHSANQTPLFSGIGETPRLDRLPL